MRSFFKDSSVNWVQNTPVATTVNTSTPTTIAEVVINCKGRGTVLIIGSGDGNPNNGSADWNTIQIFVDGAACGPFIIIQGSGASANHGWGITRMANVGPGSHTIQIKAANGSGSITYGETGASQGPSLVAVELN